MADYSVADQILHRLALGLPFLAEAVHDIERATFLKSAPRNEGNHVFVCGLARSGTTILMREIYATAQFGSLTYADMPFVLAPNLWAKLSNNHGKQSQKSERAHGDGIDVDNQSPEALDEVYWRIFDGPTYVGTDALMPHTPSKELIAGYEDLIRLVLRKTGKTRYLSKNNNNILRIGSLSAAMPEAHFLIPVRHPLDQAQSLWKQHRRFLDAPRFTQSYMTWLGHHEFGATHRPFRFSSIITGDPNGIDYWLRNWISAYAALARVEEDAKNMVFVPFEDLNSKPAVWQAVAERIAIRNGPAVELREINHATESSPDPLLLAEAKSIYDNLRSRGLSSLGLMTG
ncbi:sulfotransferase [Aquisediminimonas profunda]|uniref:sulfotransferase n=1 Tax=Aquisediminimonas profunda TaxID=1550733 RepID=UPI001C62FC7D|nr:sulfotransferase [Aquisediminimonas profunda]